MTAEGSEPTAAIVLAGGASSRWSGHPKALLPVGGHPAIEHVLREIDALDVLETVVVLGAHDTEIRRQVDLSDRRVVAHQEWSTGRTGSVQAGLRAIPDDRSILLWPVDFPFAAGRSIERILAASRSDRIGVWFIPTFEGKGGHPVVWRPEATPGVRSLRPDAPLRTAPHRLGPQAVRVEVADEGVIASTDTPEEYDLSLRRWEQRERQWNFG